jgi:hypothetical protein
MAVRQSIALRDYGFTGSVADYRRILVEVKDAHFPDISDEELTYMRDEADAYCDEVRKRAGIPSLTRPFILRSLVGVRKHPVKV